MLYIKYNRRTNVALGKSALHYNTTGNNNVALGNSALFSNTDRKQ
jgi:hypothetical protein